MQLQEYFLYAKKTKIMALFNNFIRVNLRSHSREYHNACKQGAAINNFVLYSLLWMAAETDPVLGLDD